MVHQPSTSTFLHHVLGAAWSDDSLSAPESFPWPDFVELAQSSGTAPLVYSIVERNGLPVPEATRDALKQAYYGTAAINSLHYNQLARVLAALSTVDMPILLLKGAALAETLYGNIALRPFGDLDLGIHIEQLPACRLALARLGYQPSSIEVRPGFLTTYQGEEAFIHQEALQTPIDLHWHLIDIPYYVRKVPMEWFWQQTETTQFESHSFQILNPVANLLYLAVHRALHHRHHGLRWLVDLALLVHHNEGNLDWERVIDAAQEFELLLILRETLEQLAELWPSLPLERPRRQMQSLRPTAFETRLYRLLTAKRRSPFLDFYTDILCLPGLAARTQFVMSNLIPQRDYMIGRYGVKRRWLLPYWYLYRLGDGMVKTARTLPQALRLGKARHWPT